MRRRRKAYKGREKNGQKKESEEIRGRNKEAKRRKTKMERGEIMEEGEGIRSKRREIKE